MSLLSALVTDFVEPLVPDDPTDAKLEKFSEANKYYC